MISRSFIVASALFLAACSVVVSAFVPLQQNSRASLLTTTRTFMTPPESEETNRHVEFLNLEPLADTDTRKERKERDLQLQKRFASYGDDLWDLRTDMEKLSEELQDTMRKGASLNTHDEIRNVLYELEQRDPELVYKVELEHLKQAQQDGRTEDAQEHQEAAMAARSCLPQFNLEGLWVGK